MICSMDNAPIDAAPAETPPVDPDREWTVWALGTLRELVDIDMRTAAGSRASTSWPGTGSSRR